MKEQTRCDVDLVLAGTPPTDFEIRGLEAFIPEGHAMKLMRRTHARANVLREQRRQADEGVYDADAIAEVYRIATQDSIMEARYQAMMTELDGKDVMPSKTSHTLALTPIQNKRKKRWLSFVS